MAERVLVVAAHPDDEVLGCGGTIALHCAAGDEVRIIFMADGEGARFARPGQRSLQEDATLQQAILERQHMATGAAGKLGIVLGGQGTLTFLNYPDQRLDTVPLLDLAQAVETFARGYNPTIVYTHHGGDLNKDHRLTHEAVVTAFRPKPGSSVRTLLFFEVPSSTEWATPCTFQPNAIVVLEEIYYSRKWAALECYGREMPEFPHPRSEIAMDSLSAWRGAACGVQRAEAFMVGRTIWK